MPSYTKALVALLASAPAATIGFQSSVPLRRYKQTPAFIKQAPFTSVASRSTSLGVSKNPLEQVFETASSSLQNVEQFLETAANDLQDLIRPKSDTSAVEPYPDSDLEEIFLEEVHLEEVIETVTARGLKDIISNGSQDLGIMKLDPLQLPMVSEKIENKLLDFTLTLNDPNLTGLETVGLASTPHVSFKSKTMDLSLKIDKLELTCDDYDREETLEHLFVNRDDISKHLDKTLSVTLTDVILDFTFRLSVTDNGPLLTLSEKSDIVSFGTFQSSVQDSSFFVLLAPVLKTHIGAAISPKLGRALETFLTSELQDIYKNTE